MDFELVQSAFCWSSWCNLYPLSSSLSMSFLYSCPGQFRRWPCHSLQCTVWLSEGFLISASSEQYKAAVGTCVISNNWSEGFGHMALPTRRQRQSQRQWHWERFTDFNSIDTVDYPWQIEKPESWHWGLETGSQRVTWKAFAILAMFWKCIEWNQNERTVETTTTSATFLQVLSSFLLGLSRVQLNHLS